MEWILIAARVNALDSVLDSIVESPDFIDRVVKRKRLLRLTQPSRKK